MISSSSIGILLLVVAGLSAGMGSTPIKFMRQYRYEHWALVSALLGMVVLPWMCAFALCPDLFQGLSRVPFPVYLKANLCSLAWGVANVLCGLCLVRIGFSLTTGILTGVGLPVGILLPMIWKGSGQFSEAPSFFSPTGMALLGITALLVVSVVLMTYAGYLREQKPEGNRGIVKGLFMATSAGVLQVGLSFAFIYSQGPLMDSLKAGGASESGAMTAVWAVTLPGGAFVNIVFPLLLLWRNKNFGTLSFQRDFLLSLTMGLPFLLLVLCMGNGMRMLGPLGASLGFGLYQGVQILSSQGVGVIFGEWRGSPRVPRFLMALGILLTLLGVVGMAWMKKGS